MVAAAGGGNTGRGGLEEVAGGALARRGAAARGREVTGRDREVTRGGAINKQLKWLMRLFLLSLLY
jgi:hypothetical protein